MKEFFHIPCKCYPHSSLNTSRGVIRCPDLAGVPEDEIVEELKPQQVIGARRIKVKRDHKLIDTNTIILTFGTSILPRTLKVGYLVTKVDIYIPNPLLCFNCFKFGHGSKTCRVQLVCPNCSGNGHQHNEKDCKYPLKCINCGEEHSARSKECKTWKKEKEVLQVKYTQNIAFPEARKIVNAKYAVPTSSYSSVTKSVNKSAEFVDAQTQTVDSTTKPETNVKENTKSNKPQQTTSTKVVQNTPHYQNSSKTNTTNKQSQRVSQTPRQKIDLKTDRVKKGSNDPIQNRNRFELLDEDMEDDGDSVPDYPPPPVTKEGKITRISPPN